MIKLEDILNKTDFPTYIIGNIEGDITGTITFKELDTKGEIESTIQIQGDKLKNDPNLDTPHEQYEYLVTTDYFSLAQFSLKELNQTLNELKSEESNFGEIIFLEDQEINLSYKIKGKIVNNLNLPLPGVSINDPFNNITTTNSSGFFTLQGKYEGETFEITIFKEDFTQENITPFMLDEGKSVIKPNLEIIKLTPTQEDLTESIQNELLFPQGDIKTLKLSKEDFETAKQQAMNRVVTTIKTTLIPIILTQLATFGISKASEALSKNFKNVKVNCPTDIKKQIEIKNKLVKQLNNIYNFLNTIQIGVKIIDGTITASQIILTILNSLATTPIPAVQGVPTLPPKIAEVLVKISNELDKYKLISTSTLTVLTILISTLQKALSYLSLLNNSIGECLQEESIPQEELSFTLQTSTEDQSNQLSPVVTNVNGFEMSVITVDGDTDQDLKRRRAVARNKTGIIMLQGEPSYSSNDQILIDELVFYIQQNDLKAD